MSALDATLDEWQEVMDIALRFATTCARAYQRAGDRSRKLFNSAVLERVLVCDGHFAEAQYKEPFGVLLSEAQVRIRGSGGDDDVLFKPV
jgi:hypothetical protein